MHTSSSGSPGVRADSEGETFRELFARRHGQDPALFSRRVLWRTLHRSAWFFLPLPFPGRRRIFQRDLAYLDQMGQARSRAELKALVNDYRYSISLSSGFLARTLRLRLSGKRLLELYAKLGESSQSSPVGSPATVRHGR